MPVTLLDPDGLPRVETHRQVSLASGARLVVVAGQVAWDAEGMARAAEKLGITARPPLTGIGVAALAEPDWLVEIEALAVLD